MPKLKQLTCTLEWDGSELPMKELHTSYTDGFVQTYVPIPPIPTAFSVRLRSTGYIAPGLAMFVYMDGEYQCNRNRRNLRIPDGTTTRKRTEIDFHVRQKEVMLPDGSFLGKQWSFAKPNIVSGSNEQLSHNAEYVGTIEVVVLRCYPAPEASNIPWATTVGPEFSAVSEPSVESNEATTSTDDVVSLTFSDETATKGASPRPLSEDESSSDEDDSSNDEDDSSSEDDDSTLGGIVGSMFDGPGDVPKAARTYLTYGGDGTREVPSLVQSGIQKWGGTKTGPNTGVYQPQGQASTATPGWNAQPQPQDGPQHGAPTQNNPNPGGAYQSQKQGVTNVPGWSVPSQPQNGTPRWGGIQNAPNTGVYQAEGQVTTAAPGWSAPTQPQNGPSQWVSGQNNANTGGIHQTQGQASTAAPGWNAPPQPQSGQQQWGPSPNNANIGGTHQPEGQGTVATPGWNASSLPQNGPPQWGAPQNRPDAGTFQPAIEASSQAPGAQPIRSRSRDHFEKDWAKSSRPGSYRGLPRNSPQMKASSNRNSDGSQNEGPTSGALIKSPAADSQLPQNWGAIPASAVPAAPAIVINVTHGPQQQAAETPFPAATRPRTDSWASRKTPYVAEEQGDLVSPDKTANIWPAWDPNPEGEKQNSRASKSSSTKSSGNVVSSPNVQAGKDIWEASDNGHNNNAVSTNWQAPGNNAMSGGPKKDPWENVGHTMPGAWDISNNQPPNWEANAGADIQKNDSWRNGGERISNGNNIQNPNEMNSGQDQVQNWAKPVESYSYEAHEQAKQGKAESGVGLGVFGGRNSTAASQGIAASIKSQPQADFTYNFQKTPSNAGDWPATEAAVQPVPPTAFQAPPILEPFQHVPEQQITPGVVPEQVPVVLHEQGPILSNGSKPYWSNWNRSIEDMKEQRRKEHQEHQDEEESNSRLSILQEEPLYTVSNEIAQRNNTSHQVRAGKAMPYVHKTSSPRYMDSHETPYAAFVFNYRFQEALEKMFNITVSETEEEEKQRLQSLSKTEIIEHFMRAKAASAGLTQVNSQAAPQSVSDNNKASGNSTSTDSSNGNPPPVSIETGAADNQATYGNHTGGGNWSGDQAVAGNTAGGGAGADNQGQATTGNYVMNNTGGWAGQPGGWTGNPENAWNGRGAGAQQAEEMKW